MLCLCYDNSIKRRKVMTFEELTKEELEVIPSDSEWKTAFDEMMAKLEDSIARATGLRYAEVEVKGGFAC